MWVYMWVNKPTGICYMQCLYTSVYICEAVCGCATYYEGLYVGQCFYTSKLQKNAEVVYVMYVGWVYICGSMPIRAIAVYVPKEGSGLSLSVRPRKKIDTGNA